MEQEDADVFEITDFTTASDWEVFIASLEEVINEWHLPNIHYIKPFQQEDLIIHNFRQSTETIKFSDFEFLVTHYHLPSEEISGEDVIGDPVLSNESGTKDWPFTFHDLLNHKTDYSPVGHSLARWYGLRSFVTISPAKRHPITGENRIKLLLSSISIAAGNTACQIPLFLQLDKEERDLYLGISEGCGIRVDFEMAHLRRVPSRYRYISGLIEMFHEKVNCSLASLPKLDVSARWTYRIHGWPDTMVINKILGPEDESNGLEYLTNFRVGMVEKDPIQNIYLTTTWPKVPHYALTESINVNRLSPLGAPQWGIRLEYQEKPVCLMASTLRQFLKLCRRRETVDQLLSAELLAGDENPNAHADIGKAFNRLTDPHVSSTYLPNWDKVVKHATSRLRTRMENAPLNDNILNQLLVYIFPDASEDYKPESSVKSEEEEETQEEMKKRIVIETLSKQLKAAPPSSLTHRLAKCLCLINELSGGVHAVAHLWQEVLLELRYRLDNSILLPDLCLIEEHHTFHQSVSSSTPIGGDTKTTKDVTGGEENSVVLQPDLGACRLHQKLQLLGCCLHRRVLREKARAEAASLKKEEKGGDVTNQKVPSPSSASSAGGLNATTDDEDEEFFECDEDSPTEEDPYECESSYKPDVDEATREPEGRLHRCGSLVLLSNDAPLYVPVTQMSCPLTEDQLDERAALLTSLGTDERAAQLRARMQCESLHSDMAAFKAANPGCTLEDFVHWYSPRDFITNVDSLEQMGVNKQELKEEDGDISIKGHLSQRMRVPGNIWLETWNSARPIPARLQKRLFDDTKEAEKVMQFLSSLKPGEVAQHLLPCVFLEALLTLYQIDEPALPDLPATLNTLCDHAAKVTRAPALSPPVHNNSPIRGITGFFASSSDPGLVTAYEELLCRIGRVELSVTGARSIRHKLEYGLSQCNLAPTAWMDEILPTLIHLLADPISNSEVSIPGAGKGSFASTLYSLLNQTHFHRITESPSAVATSTQESLSPSGSDSSISSSDTKRPRSSPTTSAVHFPETEAQEFVIRSTSCRPMPYSRLGPQRLYCSLTPEEYRFIGAFAIDTTFT